MGQFRVLNDVKPISTWPCARHTVSLADSRCDCYCCDDDDDGGVALVETLHSHVYKNVLSFSHQ